MTPLFTMTVDTEEEWNWGSSWPTHDLAVSNIATLPRFQELCSKFGVAVTYFANSAVLDNDAARKTLQDISGQERAEIGMHIHPWNTPPLDVNLPVTSRQTYLHNLPRELILQKLGYVYRRMEDCGFRPTSYRGGRYSSGEVVQSFLRDKGFVADASVVPYTNWPDDGSPDYRHRGLEPVRLPPRGPQEQALWEIPLTLAFTRKPFEAWRAWFERVETTWLRKLRLIGIAEKLGVVRRVWLNFEDPLGERMLPFLRQLRGWNLPHICFTIHSSSLAAGKNHYTPTSEHQARLFARMEEVFATLSGWPEFRPATVSQVARHFEENHHARSGYQPVG